MPVDRPHNKEFFRPNDLVIYSQVGIPMKVLRIEYRRINAGGRTRSIVDGAVCEWLNSFGMISRHTFHTGLLKKWHP